MLNFRTILLPVDFPHPSLGVIHQAATLAHHFHSEIVMLHVVTVQSHAAGVPSTGLRLSRWDLLAEIIKEAQRHQDQSLGRKLDGLGIRRMLKKGDPAQIILQAAQDENADLIMMPSGGYTFDQFLLSSVTAKVTRGTECPVWTDAHVEEPPVKEFEIRNVLCAVDFGSHSHKTVSWAAQMAAEFDASLTLTHVTAGVELWGPGGNYVDEKWKEALVGDASQHLAELKREMGLKASIFIGSGDVPKVLSHAAKQTKGGPVDYRESSLWRAPENPRLRDHLRNTDSDSERVRTARLCLITKSATVLRGPAVIREQIVRTGHLASLRINFTRFVFLPQRVGALVVLQ